MLAASLPCPPRARSGQPHVLYGENFLSTTGKVSSFSPAVSVGAKRSPLATSALYKRLTSYPLDNSWVLRGLRAANVASPASSFLMNLAAGGGRLPVAIVLTRPTRQRRLHSVKLQKPRPLRRRESFPMCRSPPRTERSARASHQQ